MTSLEYPFTMSPLSEDEGGGYLIEFPDLPGCMSDGETPEEAIRNGADAVRCWIEAMREAGRPIPAPSKAAVSARTVAIPGRVYRMLAEEARLQGLSVEAFVNATMISGLVDLVRKAEAAPHGSDEHAEVD